MRKKIKTEQISMRVSTEILYYIDHSQGQNRSAKFESLIKFCMTREKMLQTIELEYEERLKKKKEELYAAEQELKKIRKQMIN